MPTDQERLNRLCWRLEAHLLRNKEVFDRAGNYREGFTLRWAFKVGEATVDPGMKQYVTLGYPGFVMHPFKDIGVRIKSIEERLEEASRGDEELHDAMREADLIASNIIALIDPDYVEGYYSINFSCMDSVDHGVGDHTDSKDVTPQYLLGLGSYTGASIKTCGEVIDYRHKIIKMDGRLNHEVVKDNFKGTRFAVIAYKNYDERITAPIPILQTPKVVFEMEEPVLAGEEDELVPKRVVVQKPCKPTHKPRKAKRKRSSDSDSDDPSWVPHRMPRAKKAVKAKITIHIDLTSE